MTYAFLSGPALVTTEPARASTFYTVLDTTSLPRPLATVEVNSAQKTKVLTLHTNHLEIDLVPVVALVAAVLRQFRGEPIVLTGSTALAMAMGLNAAIASSDPVLVSAWTSMNFVVEAATDDAPTVNRVRFAGTNIAGIKAMSSASSITFTISGK
jgi:hypothetical protein